MTLNQSSDCVSLSSLHQLRLNSFPAALVHSLFGGDGARASGGCCVWAPVDPRVPGPRAALRGNANVCGWSGQTGDCFCRSLWKHRAERLWLQHQHTSVRPRPGAARGQRPRRSVTLKSRRTNKRSSVTVCVAGTFCELHFKKFTQYGLNEYLKLFNFQPQFLSHNRKVEQNLYLILNFI